MANDRIELLLKLQGLDYQLGELERSKDYLPEMISNLQGAIDQAEADLVELRDQLEATQLEHKRLELRVKEKNVDLDRLQKQMVAIKTNKEYDALSREMDHARSEIGSAEEGILLAMERVDELGKEIEGKTAYCEETKSTNGSQLASIKSEMDSVGDKIRIKEGERRNVLVRLDPVTVETYERVRRGRGSAAVVSLRNKACAGCYKTLPPQLVQEIRRGERLITCDSCGRILIWTENGH